MDYSTDIPSPLTLLLELGQAFHSMLELDPLVTTILKQTQSAARSEGVSMWLLDTDRATLTCTHAVGAGADTFIGERMPPDVFSVPAALNANATLKIDDVARDPLAGACLAAAVRRTARSAIVAPLVARAEVLGAIAVINKVGRQAFSEEDCRLVAALSGHAAIAIQNARLHEEQRHHVESQRLLEQISRHLQQTLDSDVLIPLILEEVNKAIEAEGQSLWLLDADSGLIACRYATGPGAAAIKKVTVPVGQGIVGRSVANQEAIVIEDAQNDGRVFKDADNQTGFVTRSLLCVPLVRHGQAIGAIEAVNKRDHRPFTVSDVELLRRIADSAAFAIENARLYAELSASYDSTLDALTAALDLRDRETEGHSRRVVAYTARLARQIGLDESTIREICRGALIHDIGKIGVPDAILNKPGLLSPEERRVIEKHPQAGYEMLLGIPYLQEEIEIVLAHQEHWDGTGYPLGLKGEEIPLGARLFAVADTYDALTSNRPYRRTSTYSEARAIIASEAGKQFDPMAVEAFLAIPQTEWEDIRRQVMKQVVVRRTEQFERIRQGPTAVLYPWLRNE